MVCLSTDLVVLQKKSEIYKYDVNKNTWYAVCENKVPVLEFTLAVYQSWLLLISKESVTNIGKIWHLDDRCGWVESPALSPIPSSNSSIDAVAVDGDLLIVGSSKCDIFVAELNVGIFDRIAWKPTVCIQEEFQLSSLYISDGYVHFLSDKQLGVRLFTGPEPVSYWNESLFFGFVPVESLLEPAADDKCITVAWKKVYIPDNLLDPVLYNGHLISLAVVSKKKLAMYVYEGSSLKFVIDSDSMDLTCCDSPWIDNGSTDRASANASMDTIRCSSPCIVRLATGNLMVVIDGDAFVISIEGMFVNRSKN